VDCPDPPNAQGFCLQGDCAFSCNLGFGDCDGVAANGCETNIFGSSAEHCGGCDSPCSGSCGTPQVPGTNQCSEGLCACVIGG
jgi:hypothetical protein